jgi:ABC-type dipeptide/oligopeptide/nickel transport system permease component
VVEHLFGYPGLGDLLLFAVLNKEIMPCSERRSRRTTW